MSHTPNRPLQVGELSEDAFGQLLLTLPGSAPQRVQPVRAFPLQTPTECIALVDETGHEQVWIDRLADCPADAKALLEPALAEREFVPRIERLLHVSTFATPSLWEVQTDRGRCAFTLKVEEDIRRLPGSEGQRRLLVTSSHGLVFEVPDVAALDRHSRKLIERFL